MKYAVIQTGGKQYKIAEGDVVNIERVTPSGNNEVLFDRVLLYTADGTTKVGMPYVTGVSVKGKVLEEVKADKIRVSKYKAKVRYRRVTGHRQILSKVQIEAISAGTTEKPEKAAVKAASAKKTTAKEAVKSA